MRAITIAGLVLLAGAVRAQPATERPGDEATHLFDEGRVLVGKGDIAAACDRFARSYALVPAIGTQLNLGDCHERLGHLAEAWRQFDHAATEAERSANASRSHYARQRADALLPKLTTVHVRIAHADLVGLAIRINGRVVPTAAELRELVDPGDVSVAVTAPNTPGFARSAHGVAGASIDIEVPALDAPPAIHVLQPPPPHPVETPQPVVEEVDRGRVHLAWGLAAGAAATAITGVAFLAVGRSDYNTAADSIHCTRGTRLACDPTGTTQIQHAQRLADVATGFAIGTVVLGAAAAIVYFTAPHHVVVAPMSGNRAAGLTFSTRF